MAQPAAAGGCARAAWGWRLRLCGAGAYRGHGIWHRHHLLLRRLLKQRVVHLGAHLLHPQPRSLAARLARRHQPRLARGRARRAAAAGRCGGRRRRRRRCGRRRGLGRRDAPPQVCRAGLLRGEGGGGARGRLGRQLGGVLLQLLAVQLRGAGRVLCLDLVRPDLVPAVLLEEGARPLVAAHRHEPQLVLGPSVQRGGPVARRQDTGIDHKDSSMQGPNEQGTRGRARQQAAGRVRGCAASPGRRQRCGYGCTGVGWGSTRTQRRQRAGRQASAAAAAARGGAATRRQPTKQHAGVQAETHGRASCDGGGCAPS